VFSGNPPIAFAYGYGILVSFPLRFGARSVLIEDPEPGDLLTAIDEHGVTVMGSVPTAYNQLLAEYEDVGDVFDLSSLRLLTSGGEVLPVRTYREVKAQFGVEITDGMGTTELLHIFISHRIDDEFDPTATGFPVPGYECKVVDPETGTEVPRGEPGLLVVRGPTGIQYWNRPQAQAEAVLDGWNVTGDIFVHREDGRFVYKSRRDDLIITAGYSVPGPEVEVILEEREEVYEAAVVASPGEERNEIVKAFVVLSEGVSPGEQLTRDLQAYVKEQIAPYKYPREIEYLDSLPKTETGKKRRASLRDREHE
jgi:2-aminobenzoate-CoA ligase